MTRLALIGCGAWGWRYVNAANEAGNCRVTHIAGGTDDGTRQLGALRHLPSRHWRALLDAPVDAFIVATPPDTHEEICTTLLNWKRPVMVEKPLALGTKAAKAIVAAAKSDVPLLVNHQHMFAPAYEALRERVTSPCELLSCAGNVGPHRSYSALWDYGPHDIAMLLGLASGPSEGRHATRNGGTFGLALRVGDHTADVTVWNDDTPKTRLLIASRPGWVAQYDELHPRGHILRVDGVNVPVSSEKPLTRSVRAFADAVRTGVTDWRFGSFGADVVRLLEDADRLSAA